MSAVIHDGIIRVTLQTSAPVKAEVFSGSESLRIVSVGMRGETGASGINGVDGVDGIDGIDGGGMDELIYDPGGVRNNVFNAANLSGYIDCGTFN